MFITFRRNITSLYGMRQRAYLAPKNTVPDLIHYGKCVMIVKVNPIIRFDFSFSLCHETSKVQKKNFASKIA